MDAQVQAISAAIKAAGGQAALARRLGIKPPSVARWSLANCDPKRRPVPVRHCQLICEIAPVVRVWHLRPDDWRSIWPHLIGSKGSPKLPKLGAVKPPQLTEA
jgi:DNA-binding transcriptional regulator YdaS (Cro superfamily)